jgi:hypothetical protein
MLDRQSPADLLDQLSEQSDKLLFGVTDNLELIAGRLTIAEFERIQRDTRQEQTGTKVELMSLSFAVDDPDRLEVKVLELIQLALHRVRCVLLRSAPLIR